MANDKNIINKLTKGLKFKINKKKSNWKTLNSRDSLPPTPPEDCMLYSDTEAELYHAKANIEANRSFSYRNNEVNTSAFSGYNSSDNFIGRSKTYNNRPTTNTYTYNSSINSNSNNSQNKYIYPTESRNSSFQTIVANSAAASPNSQPISINYSSSSNNSTPYTSASSTPVSLDSFDTFVNEIKLNSNNPFKNSINSNAKTNANTNNANQVNTHLSVATANMDPAMGHTLISPIEFDGSGNQIKSNAFTNTNTVKFNTNTTSSMESTNNTDNKTKEQPIGNRTKSVKRMKPLITFDIPPVVSPMTTDSDEENIHGRKRGGKKSKKYSKRRSFGKKSYTYGNVSSSEPASVIVSRASKKLNTPPTEEDDDVPLGIIQYKCLSSLLQESAPPSISSLQSNSKSYKSSHVKDSYGYISPSEYCSQEKYGYSNFTNCSNYYHESYVI